MHVACAAHFTREKFGFITQIPFRLQRVTEKLFISTTGPAHPTLNMSQEPKSHLWTHLRLCGLAQASIAHNASIATTC